MPCAFTWHSTTYWLFEAGGENQIALPDESFDIAHTGIHCFFYHLSDALLEQHLSLFRLTDTLIRRRLARDGIVLDIPSHYDEHPLPNIRGCEYNQVLQGFSLREFTYRVSAITDQINPMDWQHDADRNFPYLGDFDTYGFCFLTIAPKSRT